MKTVMKKIVSILLCTLILASLISQATASENNVDLEASLEDAAISYVTKYVNYVFFVSHRGP